MILSFTMVSVLFLSYILRYHLNNQYIKSAFKKTGCMLVYRR